MSNKKPEFDKDDMEPGDRDEDFNPVDWGLTACCGCGGCLDPTGCLDAASQGCLGCLDACLGRLGCGIIALLLIGFGIFGILL